MCEFEAFENFKFTVTLEHNQTMGEKGSKTHNDSVINAELFVEKLSPLGDVTSKKMFGGHGIFLRGKMFGMINPKGIGFLKADDDLKAKYAEIGSEHHSKMPYSSIPEAIFDDNDKLMEWAEQSVALINW
jgi:DNA transformation protein